MIFLAALIAVVGAWFLVAAGGVLFLPIAEPGTKRESLIIGSACIFIALVLWGFATWLIW